MRASHPTLVAANRAMVQHRNAMLAQWLDWVGERVTVTSAASPETVEAEFGLILDVFTSLVGPLRREAKVIWTEITELYGRHAAVRGLAAGEVVEEMQYLRELLIRHLAPAIAALRPRQGMALLLRLNRLVDRGVAMAVVGYTNAMAASLIPADDGEQAPPLADESTVTAEIAELRTDLDRILAAPTG